MAEFFIDVGHPEQLQVVEHVVHDLLQIGAELGGVLDLLLQAQADLLQFVVQQRLDDLASQGGQAFIHDPLHWSGLVQKAGDFFAQLLLGLVNAGAPLLR